MEIITQSLNDPSKFLHVGYISAANATPNVFGLSNIFAVIGIFLMILAIFLSLYFIYDYISNRNQKD